MELEESFQFSNRPKACDQPGSNIFLWALIMVNGIKNIWGQSFYHNSAYLILSTAFLASSGFIYWWLAARWTSSYNVGIATTLVSVMTYIGIVGQMGLNISIIRFLPGSKNPAGKINTSITIVSIIALISTVIFLLVSGRLSNNLVFIRKDSLLTLSFVIFMVFAALNVTIESIFIALRSSINVLIKNVVLSVIKVGFLFVFLSMGGYGIFTSWALAIVITVGFSFFYCQ